MKINFDKSTGLVPAIVQDVITGRVLMLGYMNETSVAHTKESGLVTFYSRSRQALWTKGETSGNTLAFIRMELDCDSDALLVLASPKGPTCHTGMQSCFGEQAPAYSGFLTMLEQIIQDRKKNPLEGSYTTQLFQKGYKKIAQKVGEEGVEVALEGVTGDTVALKEEACDLLYHLLVLLAVHEISFAEVIALLEERNR